METESRREFLISKGWLQAARRRRGRRSGSGEGDMNAEVLLAAGYAAFLMLAAFRLEWLSAHTHRRKLRFRTAGFSYDETHDHWICPDGKQVWPHEFDREHRLVRYRARAQLCNAFPSKSRCANSDLGREVVRPVAIAIAGRWLLRDLRAHPAGFPAPTASHGLRVR